MRGFILSLFLFICVTSGFAQTQVAKKTSYGRGYLEYVPADYASSSTLYPCIVFLHGAGERGDGSPAALEKVKTNGVPKFIKNGSTMCFTVNGKTECFIVLSPQQTTNKWSWTGDVIPFIKYALSNYRIDPNRVYLTGLSMGGGWDATYDPLNEPNYIAAFAPVSTTGDYNGAKLTAAKKIPVWAFHGDMDTAFTLFQGKVPLNGMNSVGASPAPIWTIVAGGSHSGSTWDKVYSPTHTYYNPNVYEWFLGKTKPAVGLPPVANAGTDKLITLPINTVVLNGSGSDSDGQVVSYSWNQLSGPTTATTSQLNQSALTVSNCAEGTYTFSLTVTDNNNMTAVDNTSIIIENNINQPPTVNAGSDKWLTLPVTTTTLNATASDVDGSIVSYQWIKTWGPAATLTNVNTSSLSIVGSTVGTYTFKVTVTDDKGLKSSDVVNVTIKKALPVANAGADQQIISPVSQTTLIGIGTDADGTIINYAWTQSSGPAAVINNSGLPTIQVSQLTTAGQYVFLLTVTDNDNQKATDYVTINVSQQTTTSQTSMARSSGSQEEEEEVEVEVLQQEISPMVTSLDQNYPNPFSNQTTIPFTLQRSQYVVVKVYDFFGTEIKTLINEELQAGEHSVTFSPSTPNQFFLIKLIADGKLFSVKATQLQ